MTIEDPSLSAYGYQLLSLGTSYFVGNNREFDVERSCLASKVVRQASSHTTRLIQLVLFPDTL